MSRLSNIGAARYALKPPARRVRRRGPLSRPTIKIRHRTRMAAVGRFKKIMQLDPDVRSAHMFTFLN
jgi:hypothetical protein